MPLKIVEGEPDCLVRPCELVGSAFGGPLEAALGNPEANFEKSTR